MIRINIIILAILSTLTAGFTNPETDQGLTGDYTLFKIDRSRDADVVVYDVKIDNAGRLDTSTPVRVYWKKFTKDGRAEPITSIQNKFGYGIKLLNISDYQAEFQLVSFRDQVFKIRKSLDDRYRVYTYSKKEEIEVQSLYIHFEDDSFWFPAISRIDIIGTDTKLNRPFTGVIV